MPEPSLPLAVLFDWDGVVINSADCHRLAWDQMIAESGRPFPADHFERGFGLRNETIIPNILGWDVTPEELKVMADTKEALYREHLAASNIEPLPGVRALLADLKAAGIGRAVGSSTPRKNIETAMAILDLADFFDGVVTGDDVTHGKPHPEVFLKAAASVGAPPERCIVIEDAPGGIQAAKAGGMFALAVTTSHPRTMFPHADRIVDSLAELTAGSMYAPATAP